MIKSSSSSSKYERDVSSCRCCAYLESSHPPRRRRGNGDIILILPPPSTNFAFLFLLYPTRSPSPTSRGRCRCCCTAMTLFFALLRSDITSSSSSSHRAIFLLFFPVNFLNGRRFVCYRRLFFVCVYWERAVLGSELNYNKNAASRDTARPFTAVVTKYWSIFNYFSNLSEIFYPHRTQSTPNPPSYCCYLHISTTIDAIVFLTCNNTSSSIIQLYAMTPPLSRCLSFLARAPLQLHANTCRNY